VPEIVPCGICHSPDATHQVRRTRLAQLREPYEVKRCRSCGFEYLSPRPTRDELLALYAAHPFWSPERTAKRHRRQSFDAARFQRLERRIGRPGSLLVVGCLEGGFVMGNARRRGWRPLGVEFVDPLIEHVEGALGLEVVRSPLWDLSALEGRRFDAIHTLVLEHVPDVLETLRLMHGLLAPGGLLMIEAPNQFEALKERFKDVLLAVLGDRLVPHLYAETSPEFHLSFFTPQTIRDALERSGFEVLESRTYMTWNPIYHATRRLRTLREASFVIGGLVGRGPSTEVIARPAG
jgi:2-polyprenyl-3-methyl-5-hydroxy-6-metoxy-1,4-benzoquinol methylase